MRKTIAVAVAALALTACSSPALETIATATPTKTATAPNPVTLLAKVNGCKVDPSQTNGTVEPDTGGLTATCSFPGADNSGNNIYMHTYTTAGQRQMLMDMYKPDDGDVIVIGHGFLARLVGTMNYANGYDYNIKAATLAHQLGGRLVTP